MKAAGTERVSIQYALGECDFGFRIGNPNEDSLVGAGVTEADKVVAWTPGTDPYSGTTRNQHLRDGQRAKGSLSKTFRVGVQTEGALRAMLGVRVAIRN